MASVVLFFLINLFSVSRDSFTAGGLLTSSSVTEGVPKDSQPSLDLASATSGDKIVTAQVWEMVVSFITGTFSIASVLQ